MLASFALVLVILGVLYVTLRHTENDEDEKVENLLFGLPFTRQRSFMTT